MITLHDFESLNIAAGENSLAFTIGNFDGVHLGHQFILNNFIKYATKRSLLPVVITFAPHPNIFINNVTNYLLTDINKKKDYLEKENIPFLLELNFDASISQMSGADFINMLKSRCKKIKAFYLGHDFSLGANKSFSHDEMTKEFGAEFEIVTEEQYLINNVELSSSTIRNLLHSGKVKKANELLGKPFFIEGKVVEGNMFGRTIGFPTANIEFNKSTMLPKSGVYFGRVTFQGETYGSAINIGKRPSVTEDESVSVEAYIFDFDKDIYGEHLCVEFIEYIREEKKFKSKKELREQIELDVTIMKKKVYEYRMGLIGKNIKYSLSPKIYSKLLKGFPIKYKFFDYESVSKIQDLTSILKETDYISVTAPYKYFAFKNSINEKLDDVEAVNALKLKDNIIYGVNTDLEACEEILQRFIKEGFNYFILLGDGSMSKIFIKLFIEYRLKFIQLSRKLGNLTELPNKISEHNHSSKVMVINACSRDYNIPEMKIADYTVWDLNYSMLEHQKLFFRKKINYIDGEELLELQGRKALSFWNLKTS